jgi:RNA polymerase sigma-70 factor (ECF subfamily)
MFPLILLTVESPDDRDFLIGLYHDYYRLMFSMAGKYVRNPVDKDDVVQNALVKLIGCVEKLKKLESCALSTFIAILTKNEAINYQKHVNMIQKHTVDSDGFYNFYQPSAEAPSLDELVILGEDLSRLEKVWPSLSEREQLLLSGKYILGLSDKELASMLGCNPGSIRMMLTRARRKAFNKMIETENSYDNSGETTREL